MKSIIQEKKECFFCGRKDENINEVWKDIKGYEGLYQISNLGRVRRLKMWAGNKYSNKWCYDVKILKPNSNGKGYLTVGLCKKKIRKNHYIHRLVATHFLNGYQNGYVVHHKDHNVANNAYYNLEWCSQKENIKHSIDNMKIMHNTKLPKETNEKYIRLRHNKFELNINKKYIGRYSSLSEAIVERDKILGGDYFGKVNYSE